MFAPAGLMAASAGAYLGGHLAYRLAAGANHAEQVSHLVPTGWHDLGPISDSAQRPRRWPAGWATSTCSCCAWARA